MKKTRALLLLVATLALVASACSSDSDTTTTAETAAGEVPDLGGQSISIAVENNYLPFNYIPLGETEGQGWDYEIFAAICETINCTTDFVQMQWDPMIDQVAQGAVDTAGDGISITADRQEVVDYSDPYMTVIQRFLVRLDDDRFADTIAVIDSDAIIGTQVGTTNYELADKLVGADRIKAYDQFPFTIEALIQGDVDVVIIDDAAGQGYVGVNADELKVITGELQSDPLGFIFEKGSDLVEPINIAIAILKADGTWADIDTRYFSAEFTTTYGDVTDGAYE
jgi:polar amino acid transport system substrate-binding protein